MALHSHDHDEQEPRSRRALRVVRSHVQPGSFETLLVAIAVGYVLTGLAVHTPFAEALVMLARVGVLAASVYVLSARRTTLYVALGVAVVALSVQFEVLALAPHVRRVAEDAISVGFLAWILFVVLREVFAPSTTERNAVLGALCGLMMILTIFTRLHALIEVSAPGSYRGDALAEAADKVMALATFQYFSTVTLTTVGFGDIVPVTPLARLATGLEAIVGQLYLAVVIASLVGRAARRA